MKNSKFNRWMNKHADAIYAVEKGILYATLPMTELVVYCAVGKFLPKSLKLSETMRKVIMFGATYGITCSMYGLTPLSIAGEQDSRDRYRSLANRQAFISEQIQHDHKVLAEQLAETKGTEDEEKEAL